MNNGSLADCLVKISKVHIQAGERAAVHYNKKEVSAAGVESARVRQNGPADDSARHFL